MVVILIFVSMATGLFYDKCFENNKKLLLNVKTSIIMHTFIKWMGLFMIFICWQPSCPPSWIFHTKLVRKNWHHHFFLIRSRRLKKCMVSHINPHQYINQNTLISTIGVNVDPNHLMWFSFQFMIFLWYKYIHMLIMTVSDKNNK